MGVSILSTHPFYEYNYVYEKASTASVSSDIQTSTQLASIRQTKHRCWEKLHKRWGKKIISEEQTGNKIMNYLNDNIYIYIYIYIYMWYIIYDI